MAFDALLIEVGTRVVRPLPDHLFLDLHLEACDPDGHTQVLSCMVMKEMVQVLSDHLKTTLIEMEHIEEHGGCTSDRPDIPEYRSTSAFPDTTQAKEKGSKP
jgi:hypothetical protein